MSTARLKLIRDAVVSVTVLCSGTWAGLLLGWDLPLAVMLGTVLMVLANAMIRNFRF